MKIPYSEYENIKNKYLKGDILIEDLAKTYQVSFRNMRRILKKIGLKGDSSRRRGNLNANRDFFEKIDTEEKAYFLGFLYADGHIDPKRNFFKINLHKKDKEILEKFKNLLNIKRELTKHGFQSFQLTFQNEKIVRDLQKLGLHNHKSFHLDFPTFDQVPEHLMNHFIRGYFDGDGWLSISKNKNKFTFGIIASLNFNQSIKNYFLKYNINLNITDRSNRYSQPLSEISSTGNKKALMILEILYQDASIYLKRKYERYLVLKDWRPKYKSLPEHIEWPDCPFTIKEAINFVKLGYGGTYRILRVAMKSKQIKFFDKIDNGFGHCSIKRYIRIKV